ncbi:hypothetical protein CEP17_04180 [Microbacterium sp. PM5]|nr:hypothetical protein CEP17_04180 [Microbacterium sp. PM5]
MMSRSRLIVAPLSVAVALGIALGTAGCSSTVSMTPAKGANDPACAAVTSRLPATVDGQPRRWTDAQATGAWGSPASVLLTCGLDAPGPSTLVCQTVDGIDWLMDDSEAPKYRFTTFGRTPAVQVYLDYDVVSGRDVLSALSSAVQQLPTDGRSCTARPSS